MKILFSYLGDLKEYIVFSVIIIISLILIFQNDNLQIRFIRALAVSATGYIQSAFSIVPNVFEIDRENKRLRTENIRLANEVSELKETKLENLRLKQLLNLQSDSSFSVESAKIIGKTLVQTRNSITLNIGEDRGIRFGMPVITEKGLVGRIIGTSGSFSVAQILFNVELKVSSKDQRSRVDGIVTWTGEDKIRMKNVSKTADVQVGDIIITSEYSGIFPPGIPIGYVIETSIIDNLFKDIKIETFVNFDTIEEVFVLKYLSNTERLNLEQRFMKNDE